MKKNQLSKNISWLFFDKIIRILSGFFVGIWIARYLGPGNFGVLNYALAYTALFMIFVNLGLDQIVIREIIKEPKLAYYILGTAFLLKLTGAFIAIILIELSLLFMKLDFLTNLIILVIASNVIFKSFDVIDFYYQSQILSKYVVVARDSAFILTVLLKVYFVIYEYSLVYFALSNIVDMFLTSIFLIIIYKKTGHEIKRWRFSKKIAVRLFKFSWPLAISVFLISIHMKIDQVMIGNMLNAKQVGIYSIALRLSEFWYFIPAIIISTLMPYFLNLKKANQKLYNHRLMQLYSLMFWLGVSAGIFVMIFGEDVIRLTFGEAYIGSYEALVINIWNGIFVSQGLSRGIWLISENLQKYRLYNNLIVVNINVITNLILIPKIGIAGAAIATFLTQFSGVWIFSFLWKPLRASTWTMIKSVNPICLIKRY